MTRLYAFLLGAYEFRSHVTAHHDDLDLRRAYDQGRQAAHTLTFHLFED